MAPNAGSNTATSVKQAAPAIKSSAVPGADYSTTNTQEAGVDEPDLVKSDGARIITVAKDKLYAVDGHGAKPHLLGSLALTEGSSHELLLRGKHLLVLSRIGPWSDPVPGSPRDEAIQTLADSSRSPDGAAPTLPRTVLEEVDATNPAAMRVVRALSLDSSYVSARLVGSTARVIISATMPRGLDFGHPKSYAPDAFNDATERNRQVVATSGLSSWLPSYVLEDKQTGTTKKRPLVQCRQVRRPESFSGFGVLSVLTIDLDKGLQPVDSDAILADGRIVYASTSTLYVATERWVDRPEWWLPAESANAAITAIHKFDISQPTRTEYRASGKVFGYLLNQWSLSEYNGVLRAATTAAPTWETEGAEQTESFVTTLTERAGRLFKLGRVGNLGNGERIYAVRFIGDVGYVVTFLQYDPLYTLDLSNPAQPRVLGQLKIPGYSAYLHPLSADLLLGLGQNTTGWDGERVGTQLSLFDVSNPSRPARLGRGTVSSGSSEAESDHHAFLWVGSDDKIEELGSIAHPGAPIRRSLVVGDKLYTVSDLGVKANSPTTLAPRGWVAFSSARTDSRASDRAAAGARTKRIRRRRSAP